jgi:hypothetical protein
MQRIWGDRKLIHCFVGIMYGKDCLLIKYYVPVTDYLVCYTQLIKFDQSL